MKKHKYILITMILILSFKLVLAIPPQEDFYHKYYKIESKGFSSKVLTRSSGTAGNILPSLNEHVSLSSSYTGSLSQKWIIAPISPGSDEFYIINRETGYPLMISGNTIKCNTSGITDDSQRFIFKNINGDYFQIQSASVAGCFYKKQHTKYNSIGQVIGYYYSLYYSTDETINDDYSYFKLVPVEDIAGSSNVSSQNLVYQPNLLFNIVDPPQLNSYTASAPLYTNETIIGESWIPFCLVDDDSYSHTVQVTQTPFYKLLRKQAWKKIKDYSYEPGAQYSYTYKTHNGIKNEDKLTTQNTLEHSWTVDGKAEFELFGVKVALGSSYTEKLSTTTILVSTYSTDTWEETTEVLEFNTQSSVRFIIYELVDIYYVQRMNGTTAASWEILYSDFYKFRTWSSLPILISENPDLHHTIVIDDLPPSTPSNLTIVWYNNHPKLTWDTNPESDIATYKIWKQVNGSSMIAATVTHNENNSTHSWVDTDVEKAGKFDPVYTYYYKIKAVDNSNQESSYSNQVSITGNGGIWKVNNEEKSNIKLKIYKLFSNYPNPFNPTTEIKYQIKEPGFVSLKVYDILGKEVATLVDEHKNPGHYSVTFDASSASGGLPSGVYIYKLQAGEYSSVKKMLLTK